MAKTSLAPHATFPHVPAKAKTRAETGCSGCAQAGNHPSCASFAPGSAATDAERTDGVLLGQWQTQVWRRNLDAEGIKGSEGDGWYEYNAVGTVNYVNFSSWNVVSVDASDSTIMTLETQAGEDPREVLFNQYRETSPDDGTGIVQILYQTMGCVQPGAVGRFSDNSVLANSCWPVIVKILEVDTVAKTLKVQCDKSVSAALTHVTEGDVTDITIKVYQYCQPENWQFVIKPDYFYGQHKMITLPAADIPASPIDGVYTLEASVPVMHPGGFDALNPTWVFEGKRIDDSTWENVAQMNDRLFVLPDKAYVAFKTAKPTEGNSSVTLTDDLTATYSDFRLTYFKYSGPTAQGCSVVGYSRCKHSLPDYTGSVQNYGTGHGLGTGYYCFKRLMDQHTLSDESDPPDGIRDTATHYQTSASGVARYPESGLCLMHGTCDSWAPAENEVGRDAPFQYDQHIGNVLRELWGAQNHRVYRPEGGVTRLADRIMHPSLASLVGYVAQTTQQSGFHEITENFGASGAWGYPLTVTDGVTGDQSIVVQAGPFENYNTDDLDAGGDGFFPTYVTGFKTSRDQIDAGATVSIRDLERVGVGIDRDTGELVGRGLSQSTIATAAQNLIVAPNVDITVVDTEQSSGVGSFQRFSDASDAVVTLIPLRQETKVAENIGTRTVASVTDLGSGRVQIAFKNTSHSYGYVDSVNNPGVDTVVSWMGGGGAPIYPDTKNEINNFYETDKSTGSKLRGAWRGDTIAVTVDGEVRHFILESVTAHGGGAEGSWGGTTPEDGYSVGQDYLSVGQLQDICVAYDDNGTLAALVADDTVDFWWSAGVSITGTIQWTEYQTDTWADVDPASVTAWPGSGKWYIADAWFTGKPTNICFRVANVEWLDHRGVVPASLWNKTADSIAAVQWVNTSMSGMSGTYSFGKSINRNFSFEVNSETGCQTGDIIEGDTNIVTGAGSGNGFSVGRGDAIAVGSTLGSTSHAGIDYNTSPVGMPLPFRFFPDGTTLLDAKVVVNSAGLTRSFTHEKVEMYNCDGSVAETGFSISNTTLENISFSIIGFTSENDFEIIGTVAASTESSQVISGPEITAILQTMLDARSAGTYPYGYGALFIPSEYSGDITNMAPGEPAVTVLSGDCYAPCSNQYVWNEWDIISLTWDSLSIGAIALKVQYPAAETARRLVQPRWPSMKDTV